MAPQSRPQKDTVERVMHEFKHGELETRGRKVKNPKQAIAIALNEAGASNQQSEAENRRSLARTKRRERQGGTEHVRTEAKAKPGRAARPGPGSGRTRAELYAEAKRRDLPGRSRMSKRELEQALHT